MLSPEEEAYVRWMIGNPGEKISVRAYNYFPTSFTDVNPITDATYSLGSATRRWLNAYLSGVLTAGGGLIFNAAGSIAGTSTYIEADGAGGDLLFSVPTGKTINFQIEGVDQIVFGKTNSYATTDGVMAFGSNVDRFLTVNSMVFDVYGTSGDANPSAQLGDGFLKFGAGGASALDTTIGRAAAGVVSLTGIKTAGGGTAPTTVSLTSGTAYTPSSTQNTIITVGGGTVTAIAINGVTTGLVAGTFYLKAGDSITVTFTAAPTTLQMVA